MQGLNLRPHPCEGENSHFCGLLQHLLSVHPLSALRRY